MPWTARWPIDPALTPSNFLLWQSAYAELVFLNTLWSDFDRRHLWHACEIFASRDRRFGGAIPNSVASQLTMPSDGAVRQN